MNDTTQIDEVTGRLPLARERRGLRNPIDRLAARAIQAQLARIADGHLTIEDPWGTTTFGRPSLLSASVRVERPDVYRRVLTGGTLAAARAYRDGSWTADDLTAVCRIFARNARLIDGIDDRWARLTRPWNRFSHRLRRNSRAGSRRNIRAHYDLGNDFFALFLDETMSYSCGIFERPNATMYEASVAKIERVCRTLELSPSDSLVEIGSGWGGLAIHAASRYGCRVTTATVSRAQQALAVERVAAAGLDDRITVQLADYRDLEGRFDKLASIEMIEAVGHEYLDTYFAACARLLAPGGLMLVQAITVPDDRYDKHRRTVDFIQQDIFPGSCIPSLGVMRAASRRAGLEVLDVLDITPHYAETLRRWRAAFMARRDEVRALGLDENFIRMWEYYLAYVEAGFEERVTGNVQILFRRPAAAHGAFGHTAGRTSGRSAAGGLR